MIRVVLPFHLRNLSRKDDGVCRLACARHWPQTRPVETQPMK